MEADQQKKEYTSTRKPRKKGTLRSELDRANEQLAVLRKELELNNAFTDDLRKKYSILFDFAPSGYITLSADHRISEINPRGRQILSDFSDTLIGRDFSEFVTAWSISDLESFYQRIRFSPNKEFCEVDLKGDVVGRKMAFIEGRYYAHSEELILNIIDVSGLELSALLLQQTQQNYETFFNSIEEFLFVMEPSGKLIYTNRTAREKLGFNDKYLHKLTFEKLHPPHLQEAASFSFQSMLAGSEKLLDLPLMDVQGNEIPVETRLAHGQWSGQAAIFAVSKDMTAHKLAEQILRVSEKKYRTMLNASPDGILLIGMNGAIIEISELGMELFGAVPRKTILGRQLSEFIPEDELSVYDQFIERTLAEGLTQNTELLIRRNDNTQFQGELSATLIQASDGSPISYLLIIRDITQRKKAEAKQIHADRMANLGEMASGIAHEINQPLNIISMILDAVLLESTRGKEINISFVKEKFEKVFLNITRIRNIIDHIRAFSRSHDDYVLSPFSINSAIENAVSMTTEQLKHLGISLKLLLDHTLPSIYGNTYKFEQVIVNLLVNAKDAVIEKKHSAKGIIEMEIIIRSFISNNMVVVEVADNGIGIRDEEINNVMLPFYTTKEESKGTGLGLSICYQIIRDMNGSIDIISSRNKGTTIRITIDPKARIQRDNSNRIE
jgi:PAS domain S-box-containing protein